MRKDGFPSGPVGTDPGSESPGLADLADLPWNVPGTMGTHHMFATSNLLLSERPFNLQFTMRARGQEEMSHSKRLPGKRVFT